MKTPDHIDGVPITKPCTPHDRGYIKGWQARQGEIDDLRVEICRLKEELAEEKRESKEGWYRWNLLKTKP